MKTHVNCRSNFGQWIKPGHTRHGANINLKFNQNCQFYFSEVHRKPVRFEANTSCSSNSSEISTSSIQRIIDRLKNEGKRSSTRKNYHCVWALFNNFFIRLDEKPEKWEDRLTLFVGYLINSKKKSTTVKSYISAIKAVLKEDGIDISEDRCLITSLTKACRYVNDTVRISLPIQKTLLNILLDQVDELYDKQFYLATMYKALYSTTYYGLFRIGEVTKGSHPILAADVHIGENKDKVLFVLRTSKTHWYDSKPQTVKICRVNAAYEAPKKNKHKCPFQLIRDYLAVRLPYKTDEPFFIFRDRSPVRPENMRTTLKVILKRGGFDPKYYSCKGMRAGRAVDLKNFGLSIESIKNLGRWSSNAVFTYLKNS